MAGNISTSSLFKSAASRQAKILSFQDQEAAFEYSQSAKTYDDFVTYSNYIGDRLSTTTDPSQALTYTKAINSAQSGYISNEIQRQSINVIEGGGTNTDKYHAMTDLFYQAADSGNYDLAQSMHLQLDNLSVTIQNEQIAAQRAAGALAMNGVKTLDAFNKLVTKGTDLIQLPDGSYIKPLAMLNAEAAANGETAHGYFQEAYATLIALHQVVADAYTSATTQEAVDSIESKYGDVLNGTKGYIKVAGQTDMLNIQDVELAYRSQLAGNPLYSPTASRDEATGALTYQLKANKVDDFTWVRQDDGTYNAVETRAQVVGPNESLKAQITDDGSFLGATSKSGTSQAYNPKTGKVEEIKTSGVPTVGERLNNLGIQATQNNDGTLTLILPDGSVYQGAINPDGSVNYFGQPGQYSGGQAGLYKIDITTGNMREVAPDEASIFGASGQFGQISKPSDAGVNIIKSLAGVSQNDGKLFGTGSTIGNVFKGIPYAMPQENDFSGLGAPVIGGNLQGTTQLLNHAQQRQDTLQALASAQQLTQPSNVSNLNQTPVQQFAQNGQPIRQLSVAAPAPTPRLSVATPTPTPHVVVAAPAPTPRITSVGVAGPQPTVRVQ